MSAKIEKLQIDNDGNFLDSEFFHDGPPSGSVDPEHSFQFKVKIMGDCRGGRFIEPEFPEKILAGLLESCPDCINVEVAEIDVDKCDAIFRNERGKRFLSGCPLSHRQ